MLLTTHYMEEADRLCSRLAIIDNGHVVVEGRPEALKAGVGADTVVVQLGQGGREATRPPVGGVDRAAAEAAPDGDGAGKDARKTASSAGCSRAWWPAKPWPRTTGA